ncbi:Elongation of very long chain fatty acids protein 4 [Eumeta japonica]|uniref:Elongation of very long chain fatty acids protein n=1 Tax=Eumeta variegata TaxID=151549 RepID=A0A4C1ZA29_EUMVA|nr:Elongation of very long chain fatty acids protein 4 [Eumeta japonica]
MSVTGVDVKNSIKTGAESGEEMGGYLVLNDIWPYFIAKHVDLMDTVFFVLRKKVEQVSFLHVYHHCVMVTWSWLHLFYFPTDQFVFVGHLNSTVHVLMYTYYGLSTMGPAFIKYLWWKKHLTKVQLEERIPLSCMSSDHACNYEPGCCCFLGSDPSRTRFRHDFTSDSEPNFYLSRVSLWRTLAPGPAFNSDFDDNLFITDLNSGLVFVNILLRPDDEVAVNLRAAMYSFGERTCYLVHTEIKYELWRLSCKSIDFSNPSPHNNILAGRKSHGDSSDRGRRMRSEFPFGKMI